MSEIVLKVEDLQVQFHTDDGLVRAVGGISFDVRAGETLGIVGESGSGKTVANLALMGLVPQPPGKITSGRALYRGEDLLKLDSRQLQKIRGRKIAMIFQDPMTALNPFLTIEEQMTEVTMLHLGHTHKQARQHAIEMLEQVGIPGVSDRIDSYPHEFSGGMRQRVMIAMALSCQPEILIADEPTTALDVTIQAQILNLLKDLQREHGTAVILITHDLGVVANVCDRVLVMYGGKIVEQATSADLLTKPRHPYTLGLLQSAPRLDEEKSELLQAIDGQPPDPSDLPPGCSFEPRCPYRLDRCSKETPLLTEDSSGRQFACFVDLDRAKPREVVND